MIAVRCNFSVKVVKVSIWKGGWRRQKKIRKTRIFFFGLTLVDKVFRSIYMAALPGSSSAIIKTVSMLQSVTKCPRQKKKWNNRISFLWAHSGKTLNGWQDVQIHTLAFLRNWDNVNGCLNRGSPQKVKHSIPLVKRSWEQFLFLRLLIWKALSSSLMATI